MPSEENIGHRWATEFSVDPDEVEAEFDSQAQQYEQDLREWGYRVPEDSEPLLTRYVPRSAKLLDAGCGTGMIGAAQYELGYHTLYGCDLSHAMLALAEAKGIYQQLLRADLSQPLPYAEDEFDAATCLGTLSFIADAVLPLREFCRVTRGGGIVLFSHRRDLVESRDCLALFQQLEQEGLWQKEWHSDWLPYLPLHPSYGEAITVGYFVYRVGEP